MEHEKKEDDLYNKLFRLAIFFRELKHDEYVQKILAVMIKVWPERVIARGELIQDDEISDSEL